MRLTVLGGCGAWPAAGSACSGYLVEHDGFRLLIDPGYASLPRLLEILDAAELDAVLVSHGHPDHCADLNPLLRARALRDDPDSERPGAMPCQLLDHGTGYLCAAAVLHSLAAQAQRGGTHFRELSLARTGHWLLGQDRPAGDAATPADEDASPWLTAVDTVDGPMTAVLPLGQLNGANLTWPRRLDGYGGAQPAWGSG